MIDPKSGSEDLPELNDPLVVVAFEGWNDAGDAATGALEHLELIWDAKPLAALDPEDYYDFQVNRPTVSLVGGVSRRDRVADDAHLGGPAAGQRAGRRPDPRHRAQHAVAGVLRRADRDPRSELDVSIVVALGALLADTPHTRPTPVTGSAYDAESARAYGLETSRYEGPTGILGVFQDACVQAGLPAISFWAAVPHYVSQPPSPRATVALLQRVEEVLEITVPLGALPQQAEDWVKTVDEMANEDDEVVEYVRSLEERATEVDLSQANGDTIAREFERYLRRRGVLTRSSGPHRGQVPSPSREPLRRSIAETLRAATPHDGSAQQGSHLRGCVGVEEPVVHGEREPVGHARHVVDDLGDRVGLGVPVGGRDELGVGQVVVDQPADDVDGHVLLPGRGVGLVDALEHEGPQLVHRLERLRAP